MKILVCCGFFESHLPTYREYSYSEQLAAMGHDVTLLCGDQSAIWKHSRVKIPVTEPATLDKEFVAKTGVRLIRKHVFFRYSDFVAFWPDVKAIRDADIVHVIEFRQGVTLLVALLAWLMGKPVVYDHEQRGDRKARWYSRIDSLVRRMFITVGSLTVSCMRHTVLANREHYRSCALRKTREMFAPLGADPKKFYQDDAERASIRAELGLRPDERCAVVSGKLHVDKRIPSVVKACRRAGLRLILVGLIPDDVRAEIDALPPGDEIIIANVDTAGLRRVYNGADIAIFTTFTLSYWEALATGLFLVAPRTGFTEMAIEAQSNVALFGDPSMFSISDEKYRDDVDIEDALTATLTTLQPPPREPNLVFSAPIQTGKLADLYADLLRDRAAA